MGKNKKERPVKKSKAKFVGIGIIAAIAIFVAFWVGKAIMLMF